MVKLQQEIKLDTTTWNQMETMRLLKGAPGTTYQESTETEQIVLRDWIRSLLQKGPVTVTFVKADGAERTMRCTLDHALIPETPIKPKPVDGIVKESRQKKAPDPHSLRVFDLDLNEWRSFRFERLLKVSTEIVFG